MDQYGQIAIHAATYVNQGFTPEQAWEKASCEILTKGSASQKKGCPRTTFLGLYDSTIAYPNAEHARDARKYLLANPNVKITANALWNAVLKGNNKKHNSQMNVVLALYENGLLPR